MIDYSTYNLHWLETKHNTKYNYKLHELDATDATWLDKFDLVACETYLGRAYSTPPNRDNLVENIANVDIIIKKFLKNVRRQCPSNTRFCLGLPAWFVGGQTKHLPTLDRIEDLGYNRVAFKYAKNSDLIYHRPDQIVGRELVTLIRK
jgi:hypothetical protein